MTIALKAALVVLGTGAYVALALIGWGGVRMFFASPARTALVAATAVLAGASLFADGNLSPGVREDRGNRWVIAVLGLVGMLGAFVPAYSERRGLWLIDGDAVRWLGVVLFAAGGVLRLWPVFVLGRRFSGLVAIQPGHALVTSGVYRVVRHPSYLGLIVSSLGWGLAFRSVLGVLLAALTLPPILARIRSEERLLASEFGDEYRAYRSRTARLVPGLY